MKKYTIEKISTDNYCLKYKEKEISFHTDIGITVEMQQATKAARIKMLKDLSAEGMSLKQFTIEEKKAGKTYSDNTNKVELENAYINDEVANVFNKICEKNFGLDLISLINDIELEEGEIEEFSQELANALLGKTPSLKKE